MKILIYSLNFSPEITGIGKYSGEMVQWLSNRGHEVRVVCAPPHYPAWRIDPDHTGRLYRREAFGTASVWRAPLWMPSRPGGLRRVLHLLSFSLSSAPLMLRQLAWQPQVVLVVAPALVCAPMGWLVARLSAAKAWLHIQDFELDVAFRMGHLKGDWLQRLAFRLERGLLRRFDRVTTISGMMLSRLHGKHGAPERTGLFPNWVDIRGIRPLDVDSPYRAELGLAPGVRVFLFSGTLGDKQGLDIIPEVARLLASRTDICFVVAGEGVMKAMLKAAAADLPNLRVLPLQPLARLSEFLGLAHAHLLTQNPDAQDLVLPSKLTGMLASGRPVIATAHEGSELARVVNGRGLRVAPSSAQELAHAVIRLAEDPELAAEYGRLARRHAEEQLGMDGVLGQIEEDLQALLLQRPFFLDTITEATAERGDHLT